MTAYLNGLATAVPPHELPQNLVQVKAQAILGPKYPQFERLLSTFVSSGIERRYSVAPFEWFEEPKGWTDRNSLYLQGGTRMFIDAARGALADAGWQADEVDTIVTVTSTGVATPTLEALALKDMGFRTDVLRVPVFGLGCAGGVSGLAIAEAQAAARPGSKVLLVVVETCTLSFRSDRMQKADIIATVLFGDGASAACLSTENTRADGLNIAFGPGYQHTWIDTLQIMGWDVDDVGLGVIFDRSIPDFATEHFADAVYGALAATDLKPAQIDRFVCHPGGAKVVDAIERSLGLDQGILDAEREVLRGYGNMSAPTVLFVLDHVLKAGARGQMMACALGPGFTASFIPLWVEMADA
ncbi:MAG: 3-oxoacyl-[acyl-carrier-protein] synthase III C-terminal domain-containing protein [Pseudomonadota bacterium]